MLQYATLEWNADNTPQSAQFGDVYFSRAGGRAETDYVFLQGCELPEGWAECAQYCIGETGFGTGLNFLHTWSVFEKTAPPDAQLHFVSVEQFPLAPHDLARALAGWEGSEAQALIENYPLPIAGWHRLDFGRVHLTLGFGEAQALLSDYVSQMDAWFLDGFSPAKNAAMWSDGLLDAVANLSHTGTRIASFTAAGEVRRALAARGFTIERREGFGHKRHAISGVYTAQHAKRTAAHRPEHAVVIGAGIAGASMAYALAKRGVRVDVLEQQAQPAQAASGNAAAVLYPHITQQWGANMAWHLAGFCHATRLLKEAPYAHLCGMLKTPKDAKDEARLRAACEQFEAEVMHWVTPEEVAPLLGVAPPFAGAWFARSGWVRPKEWCAALLNHPHITLHTNVTCTALKEDTVQCADGRTWQSKHVIVTTAYDAETLLPQLSGAMFQSAGQVSVVASHELQQKVHSVLCHRGYVVPYEEGVLVGATYDHEDFSGAVRADNHQKNAAELRAALPNMLAENVDAAHWTGRTSLRASTRDRLPLVGEVESGVYVSAGHGSRGMVSAPYAAEVIAAHICAEPAPIGTALARAVHPLRYLRKG